MVRSFSFRFLESLGSPKWSSASVAIQITHQFGTQSSKPVTQSSKAVSPRHREITSPDSGEPPVIRSNGYSTTQTQQLEAPPAFPPKKSWTANHQYRSLGQPKNPGMKKNVPQIISKTWQMQVNLKKKSKTLDCYVSWNGKHPRISRTQKKLEEKLFIFSTHRDLKRLLKLITTPCTIPTWPRKKFSQTPRNGVSKKKTKPFKHVGIIYLGDSGPK